MDLRETLPPKGSFYKLVVELHQTQQKASLLYEDSGVTRAGGMITKVYSKDNRQFLQLDSGLEIPIDQIYALNGLFSADYSEC